METPEAADDRNTGRKNPRSAAQSTTVEPNSGAAAAPQADSGASQLDFFEAGIRLFRAGQFGQARELFSKAIDGPERDVSDRAQLHISMCERRLGPAAVVLRTLEDHYNYAITLINARDLANARRHLRVALELDRSADHVYYALALCDGLAGELQSAYENLKRAIELQPRNRISARQDSDFASFAGKPPLDSLLNPESK